MLKIAVLGIWMVLVTASATLGAAYLKSGAMETPPGDSADAGVEELKAEMTSIPMIRNGEIVGYIIIQLSFQADRAIMEERNIEPLPYLNDAAFRVIFGHTDIDYQRMREADLQTLTDAISTLR